MRDAKQEADLFIAKHFAPRTSEEWRAMRDDLVALLVKWRDSRGNTPEKDGER